MALINCPECGRQISDRAISCPGCGYQMSGQQGNCEQVSVPVAPEKAKTISRAHRKAVISIISIAVVICAIWGISDHSKDKQTYERGYNQATYDYYASTPLYGNSGALSSAQSYLRSSAFSYEGLIDQLEYEGFSSSEAKYGADNCGADWDEQAVKSAKSYTSHSSGFSYEGLLEQLEYEGFTSSQAKYGVDHCGADWNEQAVKSAKSYMRTFPDWSKHDLIDQLEYEGFTYSQAKYGADNCGAF